MAKTDEEIVKEMQLVALQMVQDDLDENPDLAEEYFECNCCGKTKSLAGSIQYDKYRLCNDCVLIAETGFALKKFDNIKSLIDAMEDNRLAEFCEYIKAQETIRKHIDN